MSAGKQPRQLRKKKTLAVGLTLCRACLSREGDMCELFESDERSIIDKILFCTGLHVKREDGLPTHICQICLVLLDSAYQFKSTCLMSDTQLRNQIKSDDSHSIGEIKLEQIDDTIDDTKSIVGTSSVGDDRDVNEVLKLETEVLDEDVKKVDMLNDTDDNCDVSDDFANVKERKIRKKRQNGLKPTKTVRLRATSSRPLWCEICQIQFKDNVETVQHRKTHHEEACVCEFCGKSFKHRSSHYYHMRSHYPPEFSCDQCSYKTSHKYDLEKHIRTHTGIKRYQCEFCTAAYHAVSNLRSHIRRSHERRLDFECPICERRFFDKRKMLQHVDSHNDVKRFVCEQCGTGLSRRNYWARHMLRQHGVVVEKPRPGRQKTNRLVVAEGKENV